MKACTLAHRTLGLAGSLVTALERWITPVFDLGIRLHLAQVFFRSGWLKLSDWSGTLQLFEYEYHVPLLPPPVAAVMGTAGELGLSTLLALGLAGRFGAAGLSVVNVMAVISFADLSDLGLQDHLLWAVLLLVIVFHGPGKLSLDHWFNGKLPVLCKDRVGDGYSR